MRIIPKSSQSMRLLCAADLHLGRAFPAIAKEQRGTQDFITNAWENLVEWAISPSSSVDAVLLAGDIFDNEDNLYEAVFHFEKGVVKLAEKGIHVIAIAGNHDAELFAKRSYFSHLPRFHCLGKNGTWEMLHLDFSPRKLRIDGWSFPEAHFKGNPLKTSLSCDRGEIAIGMLHCECPGQKESHYAPVAVSDFAATGHRAWVLGHVHIPQIITEQPHSFYCGSLQGLDSSEHGLRGANILDIDSAGNVKHLFLPLAPLLWHQQEILLDASLDSDLSTVLEQAMRETIKGDLTSTRAIATRFFLQGRVRGYHELVKHAKSLEGTHHTSLFIQETLIPCSIEKMVIDCEPAFDLPLLAQGEDIVSQLARRLLLLHNLEDDKLFMEKAQIFLEQKQIKYPHLAAPLAAAELRCECLRAGYSLLDVLMKQREKVR